MRSLAVAFFALAIDWKAAERQIVRLKPSAFPQLPATIRRELESRGCTVPQTWHSSKPMNVIRGDFGRAVLCSHRGASSILVFRGAKVVGNLERRPDLGYLQITITGKPGFSRSIETISARDIRKYCPKPCPEITHDGIEDYFEEKASTIHYFNGRKWLSLQGAD